MEGGHRRRPADGNQGDSVKPYYQDDAVVIYHGDCREIWQAISQPVDLVLTDPPYGINYQSAWRVKWDRKMKITGDERYPTWIFTALQPSVAMFVWCRWEQLFIIPRPRSFIAWDKGNHSMGDLKHEFGRRWEACAFYPGPEHRFLSRPADVLRVDRVCAERLIHPNEKPVEAMTPLIKSHPGNVILDPFMGSGPTLRAAKDLGRKAIGIEIEEKYCEIAARRMSQEVLALTETRAIA